jgi:hypothetical protein
VDSGDVSAPALPGTKTDVGSDTKPRFAIGYMLTDNISAELDLGLPYKHELYGAGAITAPASWPRRKCCRRPPSSSTASCRPMRWSVLTWAWA